MKIKKILFRIGQILLFVLSLAGAYYVVVDVFTSENNKHSDKTMGYIMLAVLVILLIYLVSRIIIFTEENKKEIMLLLLLGGSFFSKSQEKEDDKEKNHLALGVLLEPSVSKEEGKTAKNIIFSPMVSLIGKDFSINAYINAVGKKPLFGFYTTEDVYKKIFLIQSFEKALKSKDKFLFLGIGRTLFSSKNEKFEASFFGGIENNFAKKVNSRFGFTFEYKLFQNN